MTGPCEICGKWLPLERHHVFGGSSRKQSDRDGFTVNICHWCHNEPPNGVHFNHANMLRLKQQCQRECEKTHTRAQFMAAYGKNYLDD